MSAWLRRGVHRGSSRGGNGSGSGGSGGGGGGGRLTRYLPGRSFVLTFATVWTTFLYVRTHVVDVLGVTGPSMTPFFNTDIDRSLVRDQLLVRKWQPWDGLQRGAVVTFWSPSHPERQAVKRVIALEGDEVRTKPPHPHAKVIVPRGHCWVEGENVAQNKTFDSNTYGPISTSLIRGRVVAVVWPYAKIGWVTPEYYRESARVWKNKVPIVREDDLPPQA